MAERPPQPACEGAVTVVECGDERTPQEPAAVRLKLRKPKSDKKVKWDADTVDNEHMNKRKSKCCCIYKKPREFDESSSSESDDECENCYGHADHRKKNQTGPEGPSSQSPVPCGSGDGL